MMSGLRSPISFLLAAAPPAVGLVRYLNTGRDTRMLGAAVASMLGAFVAARVRSGRSGSSGFAIAVATATLSAVSAACAMYLLGARGWRRHLGDRPCFWWLLGGANAAQRG